MAYNGQFFIKVVHFFYTVVTSYQVVALRAQKSLTCIQVIGVQNVNNIINT